MSNIVVYRGKGQDGKVCGWCWANPLALLEWVIYLFCLVCGIRYVIEKK